MIDQRARLSDLAIALESGAMDGEHISRFDREAGDQFPPIPSECSSALLPRTAYSPSAAVTGSPHCYVVRSAQNPKTGPEIACEVL